MKRNLAVAVLVVSLGSATAAVAGSTDRSPESPSATAASKHCGSFSVKGLLTDVRVTVKRGPVTCKAARGVMKSLFKGLPDRQIGAWACTGPRIGFAECTSGERRITARF